MNAKLYVGNISWDANEDQLRDFFAEFGEVVSAKIITDRNTGRSKGFGFVEMADAEAAQKAISEADGKELVGRALRVDEARPQKKKSFNRY